MRQAAQRRDLEIDGAVELGRGRARCGSLEAEGDRLAVETELGGGALAAEEAAGIGERDRQRQLLAAIDGRTVGLEAAIEIGQRQLHGDLLQLQALAGALVEIADLAVLEADIVEGEAGERLAAAGRGRRRARRRLRPRRRGGRGRGRGEAPIRPPLLVDLEGDDGIDQHQLVDLDAPAQQRPKLQIKIELGQLHHIGPGGAGRVGE